MNYIYSNTALLIFARAPVAGRVKTRLIAALGAEGACQLYKQMLKQTVDCFATSDLCHVQLWCEPDADDEIFSSFVEQYGVTCYSQQGNNLGERMQYALELALKKYGKALLIGTDCPGYTVRYVESAINALNTNDIVVGPAFDGGYVLIGIKRPEPHIFYAIEWGMSSVFDDTIKNIQNKNLTYTLLPTLHDIDTPADLAFLAE